MGLPNILITFKEAGITAIRRGERGIVAMILKDAIATPEAHEFIVYTPADIPEDLSEFNKEQIELALKGYQTTPKKILIHALSEEVENYNEALDAFEMKPFSYLVIPGIKPAETTTIATWVKAMRSTKDIMVKAVLPNEAADTEGVINFATQKIVTKAKEYTTAEYCSRIAGMLAGTPLTISATFAPLPEVIDCDRMTKDQADKAIDQGKLILYNDGEKIKIGRAVNSFVTTIQDKGDSFKKIKIVEAMDMIHDDIKKTAEDSYLGKYANSYNNKCLLISAIQGYLEQLELDGILERKQNFVYLDIMQQRVWLKSVGIDVEEMKDKEIKEANTRDMVFLAGTLNILDAIEEIKLPFTLGGNVNAGV